MVEHVLHLRRLQENWSFPVSHLAWADFKIKVKRIAHSIVHFDQWSPLISKMQSLKIFSGLFLRTPRSPRSKFQNHLVFMTLRYRIFVVFVFDEISKGMIVTIEKEPSEYFQRLHFWNQWVPLIKMHCRVRYLLDFDLKICSGQVWGMFDSFSIWFACFWILLCEPLSIWCKVLGLNWL